MIDITVLLGSLLFLSLLSFLALYIKTRKLKNNVKNLAAAYLKIENLMLSKTKLDNDAHQESFIKFLSDSRDSAFEYIEEVQKGISKFVADVDADISHFKEYGDIMGMQPNYNALKNIAKSYDELITLLPKKEA
jgi:hypothetical protein